MAAYAYLRWLTREQCLLVCPHARSVRILLPQFVSVQRSDLFTLSVSKGGKRDKIQKNYRGHSKALAII